MEIEIQQLIESEDCTKAAVSERMQNTGRALTRYKCGVATPEEKQVLLEAMKNYKKLAFKEEQTMAYNILFYSYFSSRPLQARQLAELYHVDKRTVYKIRDAGLSDLTVILYGIGGLVLTPGEDSRAVIKAKIQESLTEQLTKEALQEVREELIAISKKRRVGADVDCSEILQMIIKRHTKESSAGDINKRARYQNLMAALRRYKQGASSPPEEREKLERVLEKYKASVTNEKQARTYSIMFNFFFADPTLTATQMSRKYNIHGRTVYKHITKGVEKLVDFMYNSDDICLNPAEGSARL